ncbi:MAG: efflux RND transporter periplasmic adaptor subunit, partial [Thermoanaerobaculia bacterium]
MNRKNRNPRMAWMAGRSRRGIAVGALAAVLLVVGLVFAATRNGNPEDQQPTGEMAGMEGMSGMEGMTGMNMRSDGSVRLTARQMSEFGITFGAVEQRTLENEVRTVGIVNYDETRMARIAPKFGGFVERLYVDFTGQPVRRGQPLLEIYSPELVAAQEELLLA